VTISIQANIAAIRSQRLLESNGTSLSQTFQRLASGSRIVTASDDAAALAISESLQTKARIASVAVRNANDAISLVSLSDSALASINQILPRMAELAEQSANGTYTNIQRSALNQEFIALASEIDRIAATTRFNGVTMLMDDVDLSFQVGFDSHSTSQISFLTSNSKGTLGALMLAQGDRLSYSLNAATTNAAMEASRTALDAVMAAIANVSEKRGHLGALNNRLEAAVSQISAMRENTQAAASRIRDIDVASESADLIRRNIIAQVGAAVLAQANQAPALALRLLS
jgi:flagellin